MTTSVESGSDSFGRREWIVLGIVISLNFIFGAGLSLQGPFYPAEAEKKGASASVYGSVLGFYPLVLLLCTPVVGSQMMTGRLKIKHCLLLAYLIVGSCLIFYGLLDLINSYSIFIVTSFIIRTLDGVGTSGVSSTYIVTNLIFPKRIALVVGLSESTYLLGMSTGPLLGEVIFESWGYSGTFIVFGLFELGIVFITWYCLPELPKVPQIHISVLDILKGFFKLLKIPAIVLFLFTTIVTALGTAFVSAILEPNLRQFNLTNVEVGEMFLFVGAPQLLSPLWGFLVDKGFGGEYVTLIGGVIGILGIAFIGPLAFLPLQPTVTTTAAGLALFGLGQGSLIASNFYNLNHGRRCSEVLANMTSIIWVAVYYVGGSSLGGWIGATLAGVLYDGFGFRVASLFLVSVYVIMCFLVLIYILVDKSSQVSILETRGDEIRRLATPQENYETEARPLLEKPFQ